VTVYAALTRSVPASMADCELTHVEREPIDVEGARAELKNYRAALRGGDVRVFRLDPDDAFPDCPFVEDLALDLVEGPRILCNPGVASRRGERAIVGRALTELGRVVAMPDELSLDGGDVMLARDRLYVGLSSRTSADAAEWLGEVSGREVVRVEVSDVLHLKTAVGLLDDDTLLVAPSGVDRDALQGFQLIEHREPNVLTLPDRVLARPTTAPLLRGLGLDVVEVPLPNLGRAEAGLTCLSVLLHQRNDP